MSAHIQNGCLRNYYLRQSFDFGLSSVFCEIVFFVGVSRTPKMGAFMHILNTASEFRVFSCRYLLQHLFSYAQQTRPPFDSILFGTLRHTSGPVVWINLVITSQLCRGVASV